MKLETALEACLDSNREPAAMGICVAFSGGVDSACLLYALASLGGRKLRAAHVVHNIRSPEETAAEIALVRSTCRRLDVRLSIATIRPGVVARLARRKGIGVEAAARALRYRALEEIASRHGLGLILTAHHLDDSRESFISGALGGSGLKGLRGVPETRNLGTGLRVARPFLEIGKMELESYAREKGILFSTDSSNASTDFRRNRIRNIIVPLLDREFPGWKHGVDTTRQKLAADASFLETAAMEQYRKLVDSSDAVSLSQLSFDRREFLALPAALRFRLLEKAVSELTGNGRIPSRSIFHGLDSIEEGISRTDLPQARLELYRDRVLVTASLDFQHEAGYFFLIFSTGTHRAGAVRLTLDPEEESGREQNERRKHPGSICEGSFTYPIVVRSRKPGDRIRTGSGSVAVDRLFGSWKILPEDRDIIPLVEDSRGIVAILPGSLDGSRIRAAGQGENGGWPCVYRDMYRPSESGIRGRRLFLRIKGV